MTGKLRSKVRSFTRVSRIRATTEMSDVAKEA